MNKKVKIIIITLSLLLISSATFYFIQQKIAENELFEELVQEEVRKLEFKFVVEIRLITDFYREIFSRSIKNFRKYHLKLLEPGEIKNLKRNKFMVNSDQFPLLNQDLIKDMPVSEENLKRKFYYPHTTYRFILAEIKKELLNEEWLDTLKENHLKLLYERDVGYRLFGKTRRTINYQSKSITLPSHQDLKDRVIITKTTIGEIINRFIPPTEGSYYRSNHCITAIKKHLINNEFRRIFQFKLSRPALEIERLKKEIPQKILNQPVYEASIGDRCYAVLNRETYNKFYSETRVKFPDQGIQYTGMKALAYQYILPCWVTTLLKITPSFKFSVAFQTVMLPNGLFLYTGYPLHNFHWVKIAPKYCNPDRLKHQYIRDSGHIYLRRSRNQVEYVR